MKKKIIIIAIIVILLGVIGYLSFRVCNLNKEINNNWLSKYPEEFKELVKLYVAGKAQDEPFYGYDKIELPTIQDNCKKDGQKETITKKGQFSGEYTLETECSIAAYDNEEETQIALNSIVNGKYKLHQDANSIEPDYYYNGKYFIEISKSVVYNLAGVTVFDSEGKEIMSVGIVDFSYASPFIKDNKLYLIEQLDNNNYKSIIFDLNTKEKKVSEEFKIED